MALQRLFLLALFLLVPVMPTFAAKSVPTIRIEIPNKTEIKTDKPDVFEIPVLPLGENDLPFQETEKKPAKQSENPKDDDGSENAEEGHETNSKPVIVKYDDKALPAAVRRTRQRLLDAAYSGDIEKLRPIFEGFLESPIVSFDNEGDPLDFLKSVSGDGHGRETLAILLEVLESGYIRRDEGDDGEIYIWPYFVEISPEDLTGSQLVELFRIITAGDYEDMQAFGTYVFYRAGIAPNGDLKFFVAGD